MRAETVALLARPAVAEERRRFVLIAVAVATAGGLLLAGARIARIHGEVPQDTLAPWIAESGLRPGTVIAAVLLMVPVLVLAVQALRVGSVARDRRMAALRLAGATPHDVRAVAATQAGAAAFTGGLLAFCVYVFLWLLIGALPPSSLRLLPAPDGVDLLVWIGVLLLAVLSGALCGAAVQRRAIAAPLGVFRRTSTNSPGWWSWAITAAGCAAVASGSFSSGSDPGIVTLIVGLLTAALAGGPLLVWRCGCTLTSRGDGEAILAGWRLKADPRSPGRVAGVLIVCGVALGIEAQLLPGAIDPSYQGADLFYVIGAGLAVMVTFVATTVSVLTLIVGAADQLVDARRPLATLVALGVEEQVLARVLARQLTATAVPAVVVGVVVTGLVAVFFGGALMYGYGLISLGVAAAAAVVFAVAVKLVALLAVRLLQGRLAETIDPQNLRAA